MKGMTNDSAGRRLIVFSRFPRPGRAKTRLIPVLGPDGAALLQETMTGCTVLTARCFSARRLIPVEIRFSDGRRKDMVRWIGKGLSLRDQGAGDLGERMKRAFRDARREGVPCAVLVGSDCPGLTGEILDEAFAGLEDHDLVIGPARDGGYYLIGLRVWEPALFEGMSWGESDVLSETTEKARRSGLRVAQLPVLADVDREADFPDWEAVVASKTTLGENSLSVIIPALNEEKTLAGTVHRALTGAGEVIVVDGGSSDETVKTAEAAGARAISFPFGRGAQLNRGAAAARGGIYLFLHADTVLPHGYGALVKDLLRARGIIAGAFSLGIDSGESRYRWVEAGANGRSRVLQRPYGDQSLFIRNKDFWRMGGFSHLPIMEDFEFAGRLARKGRIGVLGEKVMTSVRRWERIGLLQTTVLNQAMVIAFYLGVSPGTLSRWYRRNRGSANG